MSDSYDACLVLGWRIEKEDMDIFKVTLPEKSHMEQVYDKKTGVPHREKVVDAEKRTVYQLPGDDEEYDYPFDFLDALVDQVNIKLRKLGTKLNMVADLESDEYFLDIDGPNGIITPKQAACVFENGPDIEKAVATIKNPKGKSLNLGTLGIHSVLLIS